MKPRVLALPFGAAFGFLLAWAGLTDPHVIREMLMLRSPDVFLLMGSAMMVAGAGVHALRAAGLHALVGGKPITWERSRPTRDHIVGSVIFAAGWSIAGTCPGPIAAQLGTGQLAALATAGGLLLGVALRGWQSRAAVAQVIT